MKETCESFPPGHLSPWQDWRLRNYYCIFCDGRGGSPTAGGEDRRSVHAWAGHGVCVWWGSRRDADGGKDSSHTLSNSHTLTPALIRWCLNDIHLLLQISDAPWFLSGMLIVELWVPDGQSQQKRTKQNSWPPSRPQHTHAHTPRRTVLLQFLLTTAMQHWRVFTLKSCQHLYTVLKCRAALLCSRKCQWTKLHPVKS